MQPLSDRTFVTASYVQSAHARMAIADLRLEGVGEGVIGLLAPDDRRGDQYRTYKQLDGLFVQGSAVGPLAGASDGPLKALGIEAGTLAGLGPVVAGGVLAPVVHSAPENGLEGVLTGRGFTVEQADLVREALASGRTVVAVREQPCRLSRVRNLLAYHRPHRPPESPLTIGSAGALG